MKTCFKCHQTKPPEEFYRHPAMADGRLGKCKTCTRIDVQNNYRRTRPAKAAYERERFQRPERKAAMVEYARRRKARDPQKERSRNLASNAVARGELKRQPCEKCGKFPAQIHHEDYSQPFKIRWLCFKHHREVHGQTVIAA